MGRFKDYFKRYIPVATIVAIVLALVYAFMPEAILGEDPEAASEFQAETIESVATPQRGDANANVVAEKNAQAVTAAVASLKTEKVVPASASEREPETASEPAPTSPYVALLDRISADDVDILVRLTYHESRGEGGAAVVETVFNRMLDDEFPDSVYDVVYQKNQFEPAQGLYSWPIKEPEAYANCERIVSEVMDPYYEPVLPSYYLYFNNFGADSDDYCWLGGNVFYGYPT